MKTILIAACVLMVSLFPSNTTFAKEVIGTGSISLTLKKFKCEENEELGPQCSCPTSLESACTVTTTVFDDMSIEVTLGERVLTNPGSFPPGTTAQDIAQEIANRVEAGEVFTGEE